MSRNTIIEAADVTRAMLTSNITISAIIAETVELTAVEDEFRGPCPWHDGAQQDLHVSDPVGAYICFTCGQAGDVVSWIAERDGIDEEAAVHFLSRNVPSSLDRLLRHVVEASTDRAASDADCNGGIRMTTGSTKALTRLDRARIIRDQIMAKSAEHGHWEVLDLGGGRTARIWVIDSGEGWCANVTTRFSGVDFTPTLSSYSSALLAQLSPPSAPDVLLDLYHSLASKVMSLSTHGGVDRLIGFQSGPWEALFGLPEREWSSAMAARVERRKADGIKRSNLSAESASAAKAI